MVDQRLTDELEKALRDQAYVGGMGALSPDQFTDYVRGLAVTAANVVEQAHTSTDVAEEPEWEYGISSGHGSVNYVGTRESVDARVRSFEKAGAPLRDGEQIVRRRKVGLWVPVKQEGADDA